MSVWTNMVWTAMYAAWTVCNFSSETPQINILPGGLLRFMNVILRDVEEQYTVRVRVRREASAQEAAQGRTDDSGIPSSSGAAVRRASDLAAAASCAPGPSSSLATDTIAHGGQRRPAGVPPEHRHREVTRAVAAEVDVEDGGVNGRRTKVRVEGREC